MKIISVSVVDEHGVTHTWEGVEGYARLSPGSVNAKGKPYQQALTAHLLLAPKDVRG